MKKSTRYSPGGTGEVGPDGARALGGIRFAVDGDRLGGVEERLHSRDVAQVGAAG